MKQQEWPKAWTEQIGQAVRRRREELGLSAAKVSDRCDELGARIPRNAIANLENGRKDSMPVHELVMLARALDMSPLELLCPLGEEIPVLPGETRGTVEVANWFSGRWPWLADGGLRDHGTFTRWRFADSGRIDLSAGTVLNIWQQHQNLLEQWAMWVDAACEAEVAIEDIDKGERPVHELYGGEPEPRARWEQKAKGAWEHVETVAQTLISLRKSMAARGMPLPEIHPRNESVLSHDSPGLLWGFEDFSEVSELLDDHEGEGDYGVEEEAP